MFFVSACNQISQQVQNIVARERVQQAHRHRRNVRHLVVFDVTLGDLDNFRWLQRIGYETNLTSSIVAVGKNLTGVGLTRRRDNVDCSIRFSDDSGRFYDRLQDIARGKPPADGSQVRA